MTDFPEQEKPPRIRSAGDGFWRLVTRPLHFAIIMGVMVFTLVYYTGTWTLETAFQMSDLDFNVFVGRLEKAFFAFSALGFGLGFLVSWLVLRRCEAVTASAEAILRGAVDGRHDIAERLLDRLPLGDLKRPLVAALAALKEHDRMRHSLGRIMDPKVAEILMKENPKLGALRRQATILFCDIRNYTSMCEEMSPDELQSFLNEYWRGTVEVIMAEEGTIDKFHGDGVCVIFGVPTVHEDDPLRAVRAAWRLVKNVEDFNRRRMEARKSPIRIGIGIHTGEVMAGHIGSERRMDYTVVGDVVNVAARIQDLNKKFRTEILISDDVYEKVEPHVRVKTLTLAHLRGHKKPVLVHTVREFHETTEERSFGQRVA